MLFRFERIGCVCALLLAGCFRLHATPIAYDGFDYPAGTTVSGQSGGFGWADVWADGSAANSMGTNTAASLSYMDANGRSLQTSGGSVIVGNPIGTTSTTATPNRTLSTTLNNGTYWVSVLYKRLNFSLGTLPYLRQANFGLFEGTSGERVAIGSPNTGASVSNVFSVWGTGSVGHPGATPFQAAAYPITQGSTYFILLKVVSDNGTTPDTVYCWFNWTNLLVEPNNASAVIVENEMNVSAVNVLRLQAGNQNANGSNALFQADELRVGTTFADVTPSTLGGALPPSINAEPQDASVIIGFPASFTVNAGGSPPLRYQWYFNTNTLLQNQTNATLTIPVAQTNNIGGYSVIITNNQNSITSRVAHLDVLPPVPPAITSQPQDFTNVAGLNATFTVSVTGSDPLRYQWYFNTNTPLASGTNAALVFPIASTNNAGVYSVIVTNTGGAVTSQVARLRVVPAGPPLLPAFPGAEGAAKYATGGRGGLVYHVTLLDRSYSDAAPGTLRYGLTDGNFPPGVPRTIVFDVGGVFWLGLEGTNYDNGWNAGQSRYNLSTNTTVAGQTAPGPVIIMGGTTKGGASNTIVRNVMFAPGYGMQGFHEPPNSPTPGHFPDSYVYDSVDVSGQTIMLDHLTSIYTTDEAISCNEQTTSMTVQYCNVSQGQNYPQADAESGGGVDYKGHALAHLLQAGSNAKISILNNLYAHQKGRLPRVGSESGTGAFNDFRNNVFYNWFSTAGMGASGQPSFNNFINNFYLAGPGGDNPVGGANSNLTTTAGGTSIFNGDNASDTRAYVSGNLKDTNKDGDSNDATSADGNYSTISAQATAYDVNIGVTLTASNAFRNVLSYVGSRWWERDFDFALNNTGAINTVDERLIHETATGTGKIIAWADDPFNNDPNEGIEWRSLLALRPNPVTFVAPYNRPANWDTDGDGMPDTWEIEHGLNPSADDHNGDFDNDGYLNLEEYLNDVAAWPAPGQILFTGATNSRYAEIFNWKVVGEPVNVAGQGVVASGSLWQPSRYDIAVISNRTVWVDAPGQRAGSLLLRDAAALNLTNGWLKVSNVVEIATTGAATLNLSGGRLWTGTLKTGAGAAAFNFTGGTLSADTVQFSFTNQGGTIAPGTGVGSTHVVGNLTLNSASVLVLDLGATNAGQSDLVIVNGNLALGGTLHVTGLPGFGAGTYTLLTYGGTLSGSLTLGSMPAGFNYTLSTTTLGQVRLVVSTAPMFSGASINGGNVLLSGTGPTNAAYQILGSIDLALPLNQWTFVAAGNFDAAGKFNAAIPLNAAQAIRFYRLKSP